MKQSNRIKTLALTASISTALVGSVSAFAAESVTGNAALTDKNFVQELHKNGDVKRTFIAGDVGSGVGAGTPETSEAMTAVSHASPSSNETGSAIAIPHGLQGQDAIAFLGRDIDKVATENNVTPEKLAEILADPTVHLDTATGKLFVIDKDLAAHGDGAPDKIAEAEAATLSATVLKAPPLTDVFVLHSNPTAKKVIYLDFNGQLVQGSAWSTTDIVAPAYDLSGDPAIFDDNERGNIYSIWARVAEDYLPFDVDVTTEEPSADAIARTSSIDTNYGTRVVITKSGTIACNCGGVAYVGVVNYINAQAYQPAWVFQQSLANYEKYIAEAISHEAGHNLGLYHDGDNAVGYYAGHGGDATSWAPIMGVGYYKNVTQWSAGAYPNANNKQDDLAVFAASGFPARTDDYGSTIATATSLPMTVNGYTNTVRATGVIETTRDNDMFVFRAAGSIRFAIAPASIGGNLDIIATLTNAQGQVIAASNPANLLSAKINTTVPAGTYYLTIASIGKSAIGADSGSGYPRYASLGKYEITGTVTGAPPVPPVADIGVFATTGTAPFAVSFSSAASIGNGAISGFAWNFEAGSTSVEKNPSHTFMNPGVFPVSLTVTNEFGLTGTKAINITVDPVSTLPILISQSINLVIELPPTQSTAKAVRVATVSVVTADGVAVPNARVAGTWSGYFAGSLSALTDANGTAVMRAAIMREMVSQGTGTFTVTSITRNGYTYDATKNVETLKTITR